MVLILPKEYLNKNITFPPMFRTQYIPDFFVAEHYGGLRNTFSWGVLGSRLRLCLKTIYLHYGMSSFYPFILCFFLTISFPF
jgi:hypothetical protein